MDLVGQKVWVLSFENHNDNVTEGWVFSAWEVFTSLEKAQWFASYGIRVVESIEAISDVSQLGPPDQIDWRPSYSDAGTLLGYHGWLNGVCEYSILPTEIR